MESDFFEEPFWTSYETYLWIRFRDAGLIRWWLGGRRHRTPRCLEPHPLMYDNGSHAEIYTADDGTEAVRWRQACADAHGELIRALKAGKIAARDTRAHKDFDKRDWQDQLDYALDDGVRLDRQQILKQWHERREGRNLIDNKQTAVNVGVGVGVEEIRRVIVGYEEAKRMPAERIRAIDAAAVPPPLPHIEPGG